MERVMSELAEYFCRKNDLDVHLVLYGRKPEVFYTVPDNLIIHRPGSGFNNRFRQIATVGRLLFLRRVVSGINPDSILSFGEYWNSFVLLALYGLNYPIYVSDRCQPDKHLNKFHNKLRKWLYPKANGVIAQTSKAREFYQNQFKHNNIRIIGNPIHLINESINPTVRENIVLTVGRLIPSKNHAKLIESFKRLNKPDWKLVIVGGDASKMTLMKDLKSLIKKIGAEEKIILTGNRSDVDIIYQKSKIFVLASQSEGFPNVIGEAMSAGLPVVAFDCVAGPSEMIIHGKDGFLVPLFDYESLEEKLLTLMNDPELRERIGREAMKNIKRFSLDIIGEEYYAFITSAN
jgi:GalNAc-alpha-(1->4)-GalNAc-alpha-(1->3)-diNAcBac-PP-undecaprenol alpha-1,4-N-acetyl-D-galactosaminyltransferase